MDTEETSLNPVYKNAAKTAPAPIRAPEATLTAPAAPLALELAAPDAPALPLGVPFDVADPLLPLALAPEELALDVRLVLLRTLVALWPTLTVKLLLLP